MKLTNIALAGTMLLALACASTTPSKKTAPMRSPNAMQPLASSPKTIAEPKIRVGLLSDQQSVRFDRIDGGYLVIGPAGPSVILRGFSIAAPLIDPVTRYAVQVAALSDQPSSEALAARLRAETGGRADTIVDAAGGLYRIIAGDFPDALSAEPLRDTLLQQGYASPMPIVRRPSDQPFQRIQRIVDDEGDSASIEADSLLILPVTSETIVIDRLPYRGGARIFITNRGTLNIANELNLEEYLRGVVPNEMGPKIYDEIEGLKAQAMAARTYAVKNLGQFRSEGYDICPTPACQVYKGFSTEESLSDQAVRETAGMIITFQGEPIDALYTSTCGGETSDVGTMFPGRNEPYLKRARCVEMEMTSLTGRADSGILNEQEIDARLFEELASIPIRSRSWSASEVVVATQAASKILGVQPLDPSVRPASSRRGDVLIYLSRVWKLGEAVDVLTLPEDREYWFPQSAESSSEAYRAASFLIKYRVIPTQEIDRLDLTAPMPRSELHALLYNWLREHDAVREAVGKIHAVRGRELVLKAEGKLSSHTIPGGTPLLRRLNERAQEYRELPIMIGDRAAVIQDRAKRPVAVVVQANYDGASFDRTSSFADWTRSYRADELVTSIARRNAIKELVGMRPLVVDASRRIAEMEITAEEGRTFVLKGLPVRWSLNVPDNLFVVSKSVDPDGVDRYTFFGKGWGHGIGLCQVGAYGMAFRGWSAEQIVKRFYTGVEIVPMAAQ